MEINAKVSKDLTQIQIFKQLETGSYRIGLTDAKHLHEQNRITKFNKCFERLVANDFDVKATLVDYQEKRERLAKQHGD